MCPEIEDKRSNFKVCVEEIGGVVWVNELRTLRCVPHAVLVEGTSNAYKSHSKETS
jgi:hypothetical protein